MKTFANAKINIGLNVVEKRPDGYHNIETIFYPIGLHDVLEINETANCSSDYVFTQSGINIEGEPEKNLIIKALRLLKNDFELPPVEISIEKNIPAGAGLGGGSSDAAFTLKMLNEIFQLKLNNEKLENYAVKLGADCPVFIQNKAVLAAGTGNIFSPINLSLKNYYLLLVKPDVYVSTPAAYSQITPCKPAKSIIEIINQPLKCWKDLLVNDFEKSVFVQFPVIEQIKNQIYNSGAIYASMSGSGSAVYGIFQEAPPLPDFPDCFVWMEKL
jgi:4-diphosphocytidyl-2C-methyl-D-erythritol kinase